MAVSANHSLGGHVIYLRLYLIDIVRKIIGGFQGYSPFHNQTSTDFYTLPKIPASKHKAMSKGYSPKKN